ncbi:hemagglutinin repeat-containing protein [Neisseria arctica]|uniref:hemagglutinin repeat-containing protein n=1 Tax=Neisseria arctica TaxID=1470200 RepID=UPI002E0EDDB6
MKAIKSFRRLFCHLSSDILRLDSAKDLILESGQSAQTADGKNSSLGASVGVGASVGAQTGVYAYGEVGGSKGRNRYLAQTHDHTTLKADNIQLASEGDTTLKGAAATANRIDAGVSGRLNIESVQDHLEQENKQTGAGVRVQVSFGTAWEASGNFSQSKASGSSDTVSVQSGLFAGDGGYHINTDSVHLKGGAIASTAPKEQNELTANRFTFENIQNQSSYSASNVGLSGGYGENPDNEPGYTDGSSFSPSLPQYEKGGDSTTTYATLSEGRLNIAGKDTTVQELGIHSDSSSAHRAVAALPDLAKITEKQQIVAKATANVASAVSTYRQNQLAKAQEALSNAETELMGATFSGNQSDIEAARGRLNEARENVKAWETGGSKARALNAGTTLITGILGGQSEVQAAVNTASPYTAQLIGQTFGQNGSHPNEALQLLAHAVNSGVLAVVNGGSFEAGAVSGAGSELAAKAITQTLFGEEAATNPSILGEQEKTLVSDLSAVFGTVSGGLAGDSALNAQIGAVAGQNAVENNYHLQIGQRQVMKSELKACKGNLSCELEVENKWESTAIKNQKDLYAACDKGINTSTCVNLRNKIDTSTYNGWKDYTYPTGMELSVSTDAALYLGVGGNVKANVAIGNRGAAAQFEGGVGIGVGAKAKAGKWEREEKNVNISSSANLGEVTFGSKPNPDSATLSTKASVELNAGVVNLNTEVTEGREYKTDGTSSIYKNWSNNATAKTQLGVGGVIKWDFLNYRTNKHEKRLQ